MESGKTQTFLNKSHTNSETWTTFFNLLILLNFMDKIYINVREENNFLQVQIQNMCVQWYTFNMYIAEWQIQISHKRNLMLYILLGVFPIWSAFQHGAVE